jgi:hypothetical protein
MDPKLQLRGAGSVSVVTVGRRKTGRTETGRRRKLIVWIPLRGTICKVTRGGGGGGGGGDGVISESISGNIEMYPGLS